MNQLNQPGIPPGNMRAGCGLKFGSFGFKYPSSQTKFFQESIGRIVDEPWFPAGYLYLSTRRDDLLETRRFYAIFRGILVFRRAMVSTSPCRLRGITISRETRHGLGIEFMRFVAGTWFLSTTY